MPHEVARNLVEPLRRRDDVVVALQFGLQFLGDIHVLRLERRQLLSGSSRTFQPDWSPILY